MIFNLSIPFQKKFSLLTPFLLSIGLLLSALPSPSFAATKTVSMYLGKKKLKVEVPKDFAKTFSRARSAKYGKGLPISKGIARDQEHVLISMIEPATTATKSKAVPSITLMDGASIQWLRKASDATFNNGVRADAVGALTAEGRKLYTVGVVHVQGKGSRLSLLPLQKRKKADQFGSKPVPDQDWSLYTSFTRKGPKGKKSESNALVFENTHFDKNKAAGGVQ